MRNRRPGTGLLTTSETGERAEFYLEGGGRAVVEGLGDSRGPCARGLSVSGFLVPFNLFPGSGWVIPEGRKAHPGFREASLLQQPGQHCYQHWSHACCTG